MIRWRGLPALVVAAAVLAIYLLGAWVIWDWSPYALRDIVREIRA